MGTYGLSTGWPRAPYSALLGLDLMNWKELTMLRAQQRPKRPHSPHPPFTERGVIRFEIKGGTMYEFKFDI